jgi:hypothetical protein
MKDVKNMLHHVFMSYSHEDSVIKSRIRATFRQSGLSIWSDADLIPGTSAWSIAIEEAIENAGCVIVLMSPAAKDSQWVNREIGYALAQQTPVIPVLVDGSDSSAIPIKLIDTQYVDLRTHYERGMGQLILTIKNTVFKETASTSPAVPTELLKAIQPGGITVPGWRSRPEIWLAGVAALVVVALLALVLLMPQGASSEAATATALQAAANLTTTARLSQAAGSTELPTTAMDVVIAVNPAATNTPGVTHTPSVTSTETATRTPTPATPVGEIVRNVVVRLGPGISYPIVATINADDRVEIRGISEDSGWYQVVMPDNSLAWLIASQVTPYGNMRVVPLELPPTITPTASRTPTDTPTSTPVPTDTPTDTPSPTDSPVVVIPVDTDTPVPTETATSTPTDTPPPTDTPLPADTATATETATEIPTATATATGIPSPTPPPPPSGAFPYFNTFNQSGALDGWEYDPAIWALQTASGHGMVLEGTGSGRSILDSPAVVLSGVASDWLNSDNLVIRFGFNLRADSDSVGARVVFRATDNSSYNALELLPGTIILRRGGDNTAYINRLDERIVRSRTGVPISTNTWHDVAIWIENDRLDIYLDGELLTPIEDIIPQLRAGQVMLQVIGNRPVAFDDFMIDAINPASTHFEMAALSSAWTASGAQLATADNGDHNLLLAGDASAATTATWGDFDLFCRLWNQEGTYQIRLRDGAAGAVTLDYDVFGSLNLSRLDADGAASWTALPIPNIHGRSNWVDVRLVFAGNALRVDMNGATVFDAAIPDAPESGQIAFVTTGRSRLRLDDCLLLDAMP